MAGAPRRSRDVKEAGVAVCHVPHQDVRAVDERNAELVSVGYIADDTITGAVQIHSDVAIPARIYLLDGVSYSYI